MPGANASTQLVSEMLDERFKALSEYFYRVFVLLCSGDLWGSQFPADARIARQANNTGSIL